MILFPIYKSRTTRVAQKHWS